MTNSYRDYKTNFINNLPSGVTYDSTLGRFFFNGKRFYTAQSVDWYRRYLINFDPSLSGADFSADFSNDIYRSDFTSVSFANAITHTRAGNATMVDSDGLLKWAPHNLALNSATPATQSITVVSGADYTVECTGVSIALSGAGTGTVTEGNPVTITASTGTLTLTVTGSSGTMWAYRSDLGGMVNNPDTGDSYVPTTTTAVYLPRRGHHIWDGSAWVNEGVLHESEARTNLITYSEDFADASWLKSDASITSAAGTSPDGTANAQKLVEAATNAVHYISIGVNYVSGTTYSHSIYAKASERSVLQIVLSNTGSVFSNDYANFDLSAGTVSASSSLIGATIEDAGGGWYRCSVTEVAAATVTAGMAFVVQSSLTASRSASYAGDGTSSILIYGAQTEAGSTPSSYVPTNGSEADRAADTLTIPAANLPWSPDAVSIQMQGKMTYADENALATVYLARWQKATSDRIGLTINTNAGKLGEFQTFQAALGVFDSVVGPSDTYSPGINVPFNIASRHGSTFLNGAISGTALTADTTPVALPDLETTDLQLGFDYMGTIKQFRMWGRDIGDTGIEEAST